MSARTASPPIAAIIPACVSLLLPVADPSAIAAGMAATGPPITGGLVSGPSEIRPGKRRSTASGISGLKISPQWAASWWALSTTVRSASAGPSSASTCVRRPFGSTERSRRPPSGGRSSRAAAPAAAARAAPSILWPRRAAAPATSPAAAAIPSGHQKVPWAGSDSIPASIPSRRSSAANHSAASRSPGDALGRSIAQSSSRRRRCQPESRCGKTPAVAVADSAMEAGNPSRITLVACRHAAR